MSQQQRMSIEDYKAHMKKPAKYAEQKKKSKYGNEKVVVDGMSFDSIREANYYKKLKILLTAGKIDQIERQVRYQLNEGGTFSYEYVADFRFTMKDTGEMHVVDVKGYKTKEFKKKARLMKKIWNIEIKTV